MKKIILISIALVFAMSTFAQKPPCGFMYGKTEEDSLKCLEEISLFKINYDQKNYKDAFPHWEYIDKNCPCAWSAVYNTTYLQNMFETLIKATEVETEKNILIDAFLSALELRHNHFPKNYTKGDGLANKAFFLIKYRQKSNEDILKAFDLFIESIEMEKENTKPNIWDRYFTIAEQIARAKKDTTIMIDAYERATDYIEIAINNYFKAIEKQIPNFANLEEAKEKDLVNQATYDQNKGKLSADTARSMQLIRNYERTLKNIENKFTPFAPCNVLEIVYKNKLEQNRNNLTVLKKMLLTLNKAGCTTSEIFVEILNIVHKAEPSAQTANLMGYYSIKNNDYEIATKFFKEAIELFEVNEQKVDPWFMLASIYQIQGNFSESRAAALEALKLKPTFGKAYILIGDLYAASGNRCSGEDILPADYNWAAADKYSRAASVDPSVAEIANEKRSKLRYPSAGEKFGRGYTTVGASYRVGCWIQENTTVR